MLYGIFVLHLLGFGLVLVVTLWRTRDTAHDPIAYYFTLLQSVSVAVGLLIVILSLKSEALISQTFELAATATQAASHEFKEFRDHLAWLKDNLSPERYPNTEQLFFSVSTPIYGIGSSGEDSEEFLDFFECWLNHFSELTREADVDPPKWDFAVWNKDANTETFGPHNYHTWESEANKKAIQRFVTLLEKAYKLHNARRIEFSLYFTNPSHSRLFMVKAGGPRFGGLVVLFSPLTPSSIMNNEWSLVGFSFRDPHAFNNISRFNLKLQTLDYSKSRPVDQTDICLTNPRQWLYDHYGLPPPTESPDAE